MQKSLPLFVGIISAFTRTLLSCIYKKVAFPVQIAPERLLHPRVCMFIVAKFTECSPSSTTFWIPLLAPPVYAISGVHSASSSIWHTSPVLGILTPVFNTYDNRAMRSPIQQNLCPKPWRGSRDLTPYQLRGHCLLDLLLFSENLIALVPVVLNWLPSCMSLRSRWTLRFRAAVWRTSFRLSPRKFRDFCANQFQAAETPTLQDLWIDVLCSLPIEFESWTARTFLAWGQHILPDILAMLMDGEAEAIIDAAFGDLAGDLHESRLAAQLAQIEHRLRTLQAPDDDEGRPHRPVRAPTGHGNVRSSPMLAVPRLFAEQTQWHRDLHRVEWLDIPDDPPVPRIMDLAPRPTFIIVHLFSGRRRSTDLHSHLAAWADRVNVSLTILSLDTAVMPTLGNLDSKGTTWANLEALYTGGYIAATISGHPCETFSAARWNPPPEGLQHRRWPRPLRTMENFFGLDHRTMKELFQTKLGTLFFLQTAWTLACHLAFGGFFIEEHPGLPREEFQPSIWRSALVTLFKKHPEIALHEIMQWKFGASTAKPTGLLTLRLPFFLRDLYACSLADARKPSAVAIGVGHDGQFRTACHKEYPAALSAGLAHAISQQLHRTLRARHTNLLSGPAASVREWISEVASLCTKIREHVHWLPDFQPPPNTWCPLFLFVFVVVFVLVFGVCVGLYSVFGVRHDAAAFPNLMHRPQGETFECQNQKKSEKNPSQNKDLTLRPFAITLSSVFEPRVFWMDRSKPVSSMAVCIKPKATWEELIILHPLKPIMDSKNLPHDPLTLSISILSSSVIYERHHPVQIPQGPQIPSSNL